jgi:glycosyltransferase involved in cell wall biosynthesis
MNQTWTPLVSTIIPTYKRSEMVRAAVETVLSQDYPQLEVIVIDDNTDPLEQHNTRVALTDLLAGGRVVLIPNTHSKGACGARNTGIAAARGELIAFLDDDDRWLPGKISAQVHLLAQTDYVGALCQYIDIDLAFGHSRRCRASTPVWTRTQALGGECPTSTSLVLVKRQVLLDAGCFDETLPSFQDFDMWLRCLAFGDFAYVDQALVEFIQHAGDRTSVNIVRRLAGLAAIEKKWGREMSSHTDFAIFRRRVRVDALIANGKAKLGRNYPRSLSFFAQALLADRGSKRTLFWLAIGVLGERAGKALYRRLLSVRRVDTIAMAA